MSIKVMTMVWDSEAYEGGTLLVLLALANWAHDDGSSVFPTLEQITDKSRLSERGARYALRDLQDDGVIVLVEAANGARGRANEYRIDLVRLADVGEVAKKLRRDKKTRKRDGGNECPRTRNDEQIAEDCPRDQREMQGGTDCTPANESCHGGNKQHVRGQIEAPRGQIATAHIEQPLLQPSSQPSSQPPYAGAREAKADGSKSDVGEPPTFLRRFSDDEFNAIVLVYPLVEGASLEAAWAAWRAVTDPPPAGSRLAAALAYADAVRADRARRPQSDPPRVKALHTWVVGRCWESHFAKAARSGRAGPMWGGHPAETELRVALGDAVFETWPGACRLEVRTEAVILHAPRRIVRDYVMQHHLEHLERVFAPLPVAVSLVERTEAA